MAATGSGNARPVVLKMKAWRPVPVRVPMSALTVHKGHGLAVLLAVWVTGADAVPLVLG
jgi:hypothetical protein